MINSKQLINMINLAKECNLCAMSFFRQLDNTQVIFKKDESPLTKADIEVNKIAINGLKKNFPNISIVSEELESSHNFLENDKPFWLVDPIDGTKEFINKNPNFTVNFALIKNNLPVFGLIAQPFTDTIWYSFRGKAWKIEKDYKIEKSEQIQCSKINYNKISTFSSSSHRSKELEDWITLVKPQKDINIGSSIKFCHLAEGKADLYPRTSPTMEWDIAAGHSILKAAGGNVYCDAGLEMRYGKVNFKNTNFLAFGKTPYLPPKFLLFLNKHDVDKYENDLVQAKNELVKQNLVAFPTETVYGLGAIGSSKKAIRSIYAAKRRPSNNPLIAHTFSKKEAEKYIEFTEIANVLANNFWPGPLTIVGQTKKNKISNILSQGKSTLAIRVPSHPLAMDLIKRVNIPILAPSANLSGGVSPTKAEHVKKDFGPHFKGKGWRLSKILDYETSYVGIESTVVDCRGEKPIILRHGYITKEMISEILETEVLDPNDDELISPGLLKSHYSPKADVFLDQKISMENAGWLTFGNTPKSLQKNKNLFNLSPSKNLFQACCLLYSGLRYLDSKGVKNIQVMPIPNIGIGVAINDRLQRASCKL